MRFFLLMSAYGIFAIVMMTTLLAGWPTQMLRFDLVMPAVAALSFYAEPRRAVPVIVMLGALMDAASAVPFGMSVLSYLVIYGSVRTIIAKISFQGGVALVFWLAMMSLMDKLVSAMVFFVATGSSDVPLLIAERAPAQALLDAAVGSIMVPIIVKYWDLTWEKIRTPKGLVLK
jgi:hypothetical protein